MHDVIVCDEEYHKNAKLVSDTCKDIEELVASYCFLMKKVSQHALVSGETAKTFAEYVSYAEQLRGVLNTMASYHVKVKKSFLEEIDVADDYLF